MDFPELVLSDAPQPAEAASTAVTNSEPQAKKERSLDITSLTPEEQKFVKEFASKIDVTNANQVLQYGAPAQNKIAQFSDNVLKTVRTKDMGEAGDMLTNLVVEIKSFDLDEDKGFFGNLFNNAKRQLEKLTAQYNKVEVNIDKIVNNLEGHKRVMLKDISLFDELYKNNLSYFKELSMYIIAGEEKLKELKETTIPQLQEKASQTGEQIDAQNLNDMYNFVNRFEKKLYDLKLSRTISMQMAPQIRLIQNNDSQLVERIQSSIVNSIPLWKNQMVIALGLSNAKSALSAQRQVTDMTNALLQKNSELLKQGTIEIAKESERGIVDIETIRKTNVDLITTLEEVIKIQGEGSQKRASAEAELEKIEEDLKAKLIEMRR